MIYETFLVIISVLILYVSSEPSGTPAPLAGRAMLSLLLILAYGVAARIYFQRLRVLFHRRRTAQQRVYRAYRRGLSAFRIAAVGAFAVHIYLLDLKSDLLRLPGALSVPTFPAVVALVLFFLYLTLYLAAAYPLSRELFEGTGGRYRFILARLRLYASILIPWFALSLVSDLLDHLSPSFLTRLDDLTQEVLLFGVFVALFAVFAPLIIRVFWGLKPLPPGPKRELIERICASSRLRYRDIMLWPLFEAELMTAGVMGLAGRFRYIMISPSLLALLDREELAAVLAHEIGHVRKHHMTYYLVLLIGFVILVYPLFTGLALVTAYSDLLSGLLAPSSGAAGTRMSLLESTVLLGAFVIYFRFLFGFFMRNFERQADLFSLQWIGSSDPLVRSLEKIAVWTGNARDAPSWHHFSIRERVDALRQAERNPALISAHNKRIHRCLTLYFIAVALMGTTGYALEYTPLRAALERPVVKKVLVRHLRKHPRDAAAYAILGTYYYQEHEYAKAERTYQQALRIRPDDPEALNNLAWLYATAPGSGPEKIQRAIEIAKRAVALKPEPYILDTLAECYYRAGKYRRAVEIGEQILRLPLSDRSYFERQLEKFRKALREHQGQEAPASIGRTLLPPSSPSRP